LPLVLHNFRMAANHGRCAPSYITDDHHRRLLTGDHLHHGLLMSDQWMSRQILIRGCPLAIYKMKVNKCQRYSLYWVRMY
jgi:hypothetical protein